MTIDDIALQILWVAAHHGLRRRAVSHRCLQDPARSSDSYLADDLRLWPLVHCITAALGFPPAPGGPR